MLTLSTKQKAFAAAVTGLLLVIASRFITDPTLLAAIGAVLTTAVVYRTPNRPT